MESFWGSGSKSLEILRKKWFILEYKFSSLCLLHLFNFLKRVFTVIWKLRTSKYSFKFNSKPLVMQFAHVSTPSLSSYKIDISCSRFPSYIEITALSIFILHTFLQICLYCLPNTEIFLWKWKKKINHLSVEQLVDWIVQLSSRC